jgi:hypothetical protein
MAFATKGGPVSKRDLTLSKLLVFTLALIAVTISQALSGPAAIRSHIRHCSSCTLRGADLSDTCLKAGYDKGTNSSRADAVLLCKSYSDFRNASFRGADLSGANLAHANLDGADVTGAAMSTTSFDGTDLTHVKGLSQTQLDHACGDSGTRVPAGLNVHRCT